MNLLIYLARYYIDNCHWMQLSYQCSVFVNKACRGYDCLTDGVYCHWMQWVQAPLVGQCYITVWQSLVLSYVYSKQPIFGLTQEWLRESCPSRG